MKHWYAIIACCLSTVASSVQANETSELDLQFEKLKIEMDDVQFSLPVKNRTALIRRDANGQHSQVCKISNLSKQDEETRKQSGDFQIRLTSDRKAVILYPINRYIMVEDLKKCNGEIALHNSPQTRNRHRRRPQCKSSVLLTLHAYVLYRTKPKP